MRIGILGTGVVGRTIAARLAGLDHDVVVGTRDPADTRARAEPDRFGTAMATWLAEHPELRLGTFSEATARGAELLLPIWLSLMGATGLPPSSFQFKVVR